MEVVIVEATNSEEKFQSAINEAIKNFSHDNVEIQYQMVLNECELLYSALVIIKDKRKVLP